MAKARLKGSPRNPSPAIPSVYTGYLWVLPLELTTVNINEMHCLRYLLPLAFLLVLPGCAQPPDLLVMGWNVESGGHSKTDRTQGNSPKVIAKTIADFQGYDIIGLCEVHPNNIAKYVQAAGVGEGSRFKDVIGSTGAGDRLMIMFDSDRLDLVESKELHHLNNGNHRSPLVGHFKIKEGGIEFFFMVNHLARGDSNLRRRQATGLSKWADSESLPIIAAGDFNFDYSLDDQKGNKAMKRMLSGNVFEWVKPAQLIKTNASRYNSILDFIFVANRPDTWKIASEILTAGFPFPDTNKTSDHRPVIARIYIPDP